MCLNTINYNKLSMTLSYKVTACTVQLNNLTYTPSPPTHLPRGLVVGLIAVFTAFLFVDLFFKSSYFIEEYVKFYN